MSRIAYSTRLTLPIALPLSAVALCGWVPAFMHEAWWEVLPTLLLAVVNAFVLLYVLLQVGVARERKGLPVWLYVLTISGFQAWHTYWQGQIAVLCVLLTLRLLLRCLHVKYPAGDAFRTTLLVLLGSLAVPDMVWLIGVLWVGFILLRSMNLRVVLATLLAMATFALYVAIVLYFSELTNPYASLWARAWLWQTVPMQVWLPMVVWMGVGLFFGVAAATRMNRDSIVQQALLLLLGLFFVVGVGPTLYPMGQSMLFPVVLLTVVGMAVLFFEQRENTARGVVHLLYILGVLAAYGAGFIGG